MIKVLIVLCLPGVIFLAGRSSAPDPTTEYVHIHHTDTKEVEVPVYKGLPQDCLDALAELNTVLPTQQKIIDELVQLDQLTHDIAVFTGQDQIEVNKLKVRAGNMQVAVSRYTLDMTVSRDKMNTYIRRCNLQTGEK